MFCGRTVYVSNKYFFAIRVVENFYKKTFPGFKASRRCKAFIIIFFMNVCYKSSVFGTISTLWYTIVIFLNEIMIYLQFLLAMSLEDIWPKIQNFPFVTSQLINAVCQTKR